MVVDWYNPYDDPNCPACDCADWGMMGCISTCSREKYVVAKRKELGAGKKKIRRINIFGGPGSGKSTLAAWLWSELKIAGFNVEHVQEWVKGWAYANRPITSFDEVYAFAKQMHKEDNLLRQGVDHIICESPLLLIASYATRNKSTFADDLISLANKFEHIYPSVFVFLQRGDIPYKREGRYEDLEAALATDEVIEFVARSNAPHLMLEFPAKDRSSILSHVLNELGVNIP